MDPKEMYTLLPDKSKDALSNYQLKGFILKQVSSDIVPYLDGVLSGLVGEVHEDESVTVFKLEHTKKNSTIRPFLLGRVMG